MAITRYTLTGDFGTIIGSEFLPANGKVQAWLTTNLPAGDALVDLAANIIEPGSVKLDLTNGAFSVSLIATNSSDTNIASNSLRYKVLFSYVDVYTRQRVVWDSDFFALTANADLSDVAGTIEAPLSWRSAFITDMTAIQAAAAASAATAAAGAASAAASATLAHALVTADLGTSDGQMYALLSDPASLANTAPPLADSGWHLVGGSGEPAFGGTWVNYGSGEDTAAFRKVGHVVYLRGRIKSGSVGTQAFVLPSGFHRTTATQSFAVISNGALGRVDIFADGQVVVQSPSSGTSVHLSGISFPVD